MYIDLFNEDAERIEAEIDNLMNKLAESARNKVIKPFCDKNKYNFECGMGTYLFKDSVGNSVDEDEIPSEIVEVLEFYPGNSDLRVCYFMSDYKFGG